MKRLSLLLLLVASAAAQAFPLPEFAPSLTPDFSRFTTAFDFEGIVELPNCSGSLVRFEHSQANDQALVLTNGHCVSMRELRPGRFIHRRPVTRQFQLLHRDGQRAGAINAIEIVYATMTGTDFALYRLRETFAQIESRFAIPALTLSSARPPLGQEIEIISGHWGRGYRCAIEHFVYRLQEGDWIMDDSIRYSRPGCEVIGGTSGSPVIARGSRTVIAVNNTGNMNGGRCTMNNPCEIDEDGTVEHVRGYSYAQQTYWVYSCLNGVDVDLTNPSCRLPR